MAFLKTARAARVQTLVDPRKWNNVRVASTSGVMNPNLISQASDILEDRFSPENYVLTHATIVASVDTEKVSGPTGVVKEGSFQVNRKYDNYRLSPDHDRWINNNCFAPGTWITMGDRTLKPIEAIKVGDEVLTHKGRVRKVVETFVHDVDGPIFEICPRGTTERTYVTGEHPFFVYRPNTHCVHCGKNFVRKHKSIKNLLGSLYCSIACYYQKQVPNSEFLPSKKPEFVAVRGLSSYDYVTHPVPHSKGSVPLSPGKARLIGLFAAEGYYDLNHNPDKENERRGCCWAYPADEQSTLAQLTVDLLKSEFDVEAVVRHHSNDNGIHVTTKACSEMVEFFEHWVPGRGSRDKVLHGDVFDVPHSSQLEILKGWFEGGGSLFKTKSDIRLAGASASHSLVNQLQLLLFGVGVSARTCRQETMGRKRLKMADGSVEIANDPSKSCVAWQLSVGGGWISDLVEGTYYEDRYHLYVEESGGLQNVPDLRFLNGYHTQRLGDISEHDYQGQVYNFEVEDDHSYIANGMSVHNCDAWDRPVLLKSYQTFVGGHNFCEHLQLESESKGRIIDAVARDIGPSVYVDILIATNRKHRDLVAAIDSGRMNTLSMGCSILESTCTKCGNVAKDEPEMCPHVRFEKGTHFYDDLGRRHRVAELCGHESLDPTGGVTFFEASWVRVPAFEGAVVNRLLHPSDATPDNIRRAQDILSRPPERWTREEMDGYIKAASLISATKQAGFDFGGDDEEGEGGGGEKDEDLISKLMEKAENLVVQKLHQRLQDSMEGEKKPTVDSKSTITDSNIQREASINVARLYHDAMNVIVKSASSPGSMIHGIKNINRSFGVRVADDLYHLSLMVGPTTQYHNLKDFVSTCEAVSRRPLNTGDKNTLIRLGNFLASLDE